MLEISEFFVKELNKLNDEDLPFKDIFQDNTRKIIEFNTDPIAKSILNKLKDFRILFKDGLIAKNNKTIRLGKYILNKKSPFTNEEKNWWVKSGNPLQNLKNASTSNQYAIILSRNPIDIVRMSDHDGWTSCHAPGREYFQCAISDAKNSGAIAYIVNKNDLYKIDDLEQSEIFSDPERNIKGIKPLSRIRLRKFVHKTDDYDLAIPEDRVYGEEIPGFEKTLRDFTFQAQQDKLQNQRPKMNDFKLMGGSYRDTSASKLFNKFFGDELDYGDAEYGGEDDYTTMADQYEEEANLIERQYRNKYKHVYFYSSVEEPRGEEPYLYYGGGITFKIPENLIIQPIDQEIVKKWTKENIYIYNINNININGGNISIDLYSDNELTPDGYRKFIDETLQTLEDKADELTAELYHFLIDHGYAQPNKVAYVAKNWDEHPYTFQHFEWSGEEPHVNIDLKEPMLMGKNTGQTIHGNKEIMDQFRTKLMQELNNFANKIFANKIFAQQPDLFKHTEFKAQRSFKQEFSIEPYIRIAPKNAWNFSQPNTDLFLHLTIEFHPFTPNEDFHDVLNFIKFLDKNYDKFAKIAQKIYQDLLKNYYNSRNLHQ